MSVKQAIKDWWEDNVFSQMRRKKMRRGIVNRNPTLLCPNCIGGTLFHDLGFQFCSPTINLMMFQREFVRFVMNLDDYLRKDFVPCECEGYVCPCAMLGDVTVHFTHYKSFEEGVIAWKRRCARIDKDNMFVLCSERDGLTRDDMLELGKLKVRGLLVFTENSYPDIPYAMQITGMPVNNILERTSWITRDRRYNSLFDFVGWFNNANGGDYDVSPYIKKH